MNRTSATSIKRDSAVRRSLGAIAAIPSWLSPGDTDGTVSTTDSSRAYHYSPRLSRVNYTVSPVLRIRVSQLPSLDTLGFALDSYVHPISDEFIGLRLCDRFRSHQKHFEARKNCPLRVGDVIVMVNQHRLATMHESQAIRYVYNAFRDAGQYVVEFGVYRSPEACISPYETQNSHSPHEDIASSEPFCCTVQRATPFVPTAPLMDTSLEQHRPKRTSRSPVTTRVQSLKTGIPPSNSFVAAPISPRGTTSSKRLSAIADQVISANGAFSRSPMPHEQPRLATITTNPFTSPNSPTSPLPTNHRRSYSSHTLKDLNAFNTRTIGRKICIDLVKLTHGGLGFTLTSRDTQTTTDKGDPVYVKKILSSGAAIADGRLSVGDRLLSVNGIETTSLHQVSAQLRSMKPGECAKLVISRQLSATTMTENVDQKSPLTSHPIDTNPQPYAFTSFTYEFQLPSDVSSEYTPSLGINFKWLTRPPNFDFSVNEDPGLYVDSLVPDGLVLKAGRSTVLPGDRLVGLNGEDLDGLSAKAASRRVKQILAQSLKSGSRTFSLTVHRYHELNQPSTSENRRPPCRLSSSIIPGELDNSTSPVSANPLSLRDSRRRRTSLSRDTAVADFHRHEPPDDYSNLTERASDTDPHSYPRYLSVPSRTSGHSCFEREGFGRRSVSEKRHGHVDASQYSFFQTNILPTRYKMPEDVDKQYSTMPTARRLKLHRERLNLNTPNNSSGPMRALHPNNAGSHTQHVNTQNFEPTGSSSHGDPSLSTQSPSRFHRGRKQNSSFRNAVDRSLTLSTPTKPSTDSHRFSDVYVVDRSLKSECQSNISSFSFAASLGAAPPSAFSSTYLVTAANHTQSTHNSHPLSPCLSRNPIGSSTPPVPTRLNPPSKTGKLRLGSFKEFFKRSHNRTTTPSIEDTGGPSGPTNQTTNRSNRRFSVPGIVDALKSPTTTTVTEANFQTSDLPPEMRSYRLTSATDEVLFSKHIERPSGSQLKQPISSGSAVKIDLMSRTTVTDSSTGKVEWFRQSQTTAQSPPPVPPRAHYPDSRQKSVSRHNRLSSGNATAPHSRHRGLSEVHIPDTNDQNVSHRPHGSLKTYSHGKFSSYRDHSPVYKPKLPSHAPSAIRSDSGTNGFGVSHPSTVRTIEGRTGYRHSHSYHTPANPIPLHSQENVNSTIPTNGRNHAFMRSSGPINAVHRGDKKTAAALKTNTHLQTHTQTCSSPPSTVLSRSAAPAVSINHGSVTAVQAKRRLTHSNHNKIYHQIPTTRKSTDFDSRHFEDSTKYASHKGK